MNALRLSRLPQILILGQALTFTACEADNVVFKEETGTLEAAIPGQDSIADDSYIEEAENSAIAKEAEAADESYAGENRTPGDDHTAADRLDTEMALAEWYFKAPESKVVRVEYEAGNAVARQRLVMDDNRVPASAQFEQPSRPVSTVYFKQSSEIREQSETFLQNGNGPLDILLVVDNSGSMTEEQKNLSNKLSPLLTYVKDSDWRIGFVTTDTKDGCLRALISKSDSNINSKFAAAVNAGIKGTGNERGILQAVNGLKGECNANGSWLRKDSALAVLILSDEDNCSDGNGCGSDPWKDGSYLLNYMNSIRQVGVNAKVYGLVGHPSLSKQQCSTVGNKATIYADVIAKSKGTWGSICESNYSTTLEAVSKNIGAILQSQFALKFEAEAGSVKVSMNGQLLSGGYSVQGNILKFDTLPPASAAITVAYEYDAQTPKSSFVLAKAVDPASLRVYVDSVEDASAQFSAQDNAIIFPSAPNASDIKVTFKAPAATGANYSLGHDATQIAVKINGSLLPAQGFRWNSISRSIELSQCPADLAKIDVAYSKVMEPNLDYKMPIPESAVVAVIDPTSGANVAAIRSPSGLRFAKEDYAPGRTLDVLIQSRDASLPIDAEIPSEWISIEGEISGVCKSWTISGENLDLAACAFQTGEKVIVSYMHEKEEVTRFDLGQIPEGEGTWVLLVNGQEHEDFDVEDGQLKVANLPDAASIELRYFASQN